MTSRRATERGIPMGVFCQPTDWNDRLVSLLSAVLARPVDPRFERAIWNKFPAGQRHNRGSSSMAVLWMVPKGYLSVEKANGAGPLAVQAALERFLSNAQISLVTMEVDYHQGLSVAHLDKLWTRYPSVTSVVLCSSFSFDHGYLFHQVYRLFDHQQPLLRRLVGCVLLQGPFPKILDIGEIPVMLVSMQEDDVDDDTSYRKLDLSIPQKHANVVLVNIEGSIDEHAALCLWVGRLVTKFAAALGMATQVPPNARL